MANPKLRHAGIIDVTVGQGVTIVEPANLYGCTIGDRCFIGPFVEIQKGVILGADCKVQSHSFICELVRIGNRVTVAHGVMFINDRFRRGGPAKGDRNLWDSTTIEDDVSIGSNATILPVRICAGTVIGAGSVVTRDIKVPGIYAGNPARRLRALPAPIRQKRARVSA